MKTRWVTLVSLAAVLWSAAAWGAIAVVVNGEPLKFSGAEPTRLNGRVMVPMRAIFEALGAAVKWDAATQGITATRGDTTIIMRIGVREAQVSARSVTLDQPPVLLGGSTMVPLRFVGEALGATVLWNEALQSVAITSTKPAAPPTTPAALAVDGTILGITTTAPATITLKVANEPRSQRLAAKVEVFRRGAPLPVGNELPVYGLPAARVLADLAPGEEVHLTLNTANEVTRIDSAVLMSAAKVRSADGGRIVLDDAAGTALRIGPDLRYINTQGKAAVVADVKPGATVVVYWAPTQRTIYQVSAAAAKRPAAATAIDAVTVAATKPLKEGDVLRVTVKGTAGCTGTFDLPPAVRDVPLTEDKKQPGTYGGSYTVRAGDNVLNRKVNAYLAGKSGDAFVQSATTVTIDTGKPRIVGTFPAAGAALDLAKPNLTVYAEDLGGSGLAGGVIEVTCGGKVQRLTGTLVPPGALSAVPTTSLTGPVSVKATVNDAAGNSADITYAFTVAPLVPSSVSIKHDAAKPVPAGGNVAIELRALLGGQATFALVDDARRAVTPDLPLTENPPGIYKASFKAQPGLAGLRLNVVGKYTDKAGKQETVVAAAPILFAAPPAVPVTIDTPKANTKVVSPLVLRGKAAPNAVVEIGGRAEGNQILLLIFVQPYSEDLDAKQIRADAKGDWVSPALTLPQPKGVRDLKYTLTATPIDADGKRGKPVAVAVTP